MPLYLADSSIWIGARRHPTSYLPELLADRLRSDEIATCIPVALEVLVGPPTAAHRGRSRPVEIYCMPSVTRLDLRPAMA